MVEDVRRKLGKVTGELIESFVPFDKNKVMHFQAGLHALHSAQVNKEHRVNLHSIYDENKLTELLEEHGILKEHFDKVPMILKDFAEDKSNASETMKQLPELLREAVEKVNKRNREVYEIPASGMIAVSLNLISSDVKNALIASQAGELTLRAIERIPNHKKLYGLPMSKPAILQDRLYEFGSNNKLARPYLGQIGNEPNYLIAAKATQHLADLLEGIAMLRPEITEDENIENAMSALRLLAAKTFLTSSKRLKELGEETASQQIGNLAKYTSANSSLSKNKIHAAITNCLKKLQSEISLSKNLTEKEMDDFIKLITKRLEQIKQID